MKALLLIALLAPLLSAQQITPDPRLTPGAVLHVSAADVCVVGYSKRVRNVPIALKRRVYREYGVPYVRGFAEVDHLIPLSLGGSNSIKNLWPEPYGEVWGAHQKDDIELAAWKKVCRGTMSLEYAQHMMATDWIALYKQLFHTEVPRRVRRRSRGD